MLKGLFGGKKDGFFLELDESKSIKKPPTAEDKKPETQPKVVAETTPEVAPKAKKSKKTSIKKAAKKEAPTTALVAAVATNGNGKVAKKEEPKQVEFATKYLIVPTGGRRRPGPSLNPFKNMAREVKVPRS